MALSKVSKNRLTKLIDFMAKLPNEAKKHFNMKSWVMHQGEWADVLGHHGIKKASDVDRKALIQCGMSACALGWGCTIPSFKRAGLRLAEKEGFRGIYLEPVYQGSHDLDAAKSFFRIHAWKADALFGSENLDPSPREWAKRARKLVREWSATP